MQKKTSFADFPKTRGYLPRMKIGMHYVRNKKYSYY